MGGMDSKMTLQSVRNVYFAFADGKSWSCPCSRAVIINLRSLCYALDRFLFPIIHVVIPLLLCSDLKSCIFFPTVEIVEGKYVEMSFVGIFFPCVFCERKSYFLSLFRICKTLILIHVNVLFSPNLGLVLIQI